ncbi:MAG: hypothetical protein CM15mP74_20460 [Halieaceae bacterium]|nr:MAG: hypothetical protein CM15mP74_20460 [Halieaceae bacterium]
MQARIDAGETFTSLVVEYLTTPQRSETRGSWLLIRSDTPGIRGMAFSLTEARADFRAGVNSFGVTLFVLISAAVGMLSLRTLFRHASFGPSRREGVCAQGEVSRRFAGSWPGVADIDEAPIAERVFAD